MTDILDPQEIYKILAEFSKGLLADPKKIFYLDEPFMGYDRLDDVHEKIRELIGAKYIKDYENIDEGMSNTYQHIPRLGFKIRFLSKGIHFLATHPPPLP